MMVLYMLMQFDLFFLLFPNVTSVFIV